MTSLPILTYHRLLSEDPTPRVDPKRIAVSQNQFRRHLSWLSTLGYRAVSLGTYIHELQQHGRRIGHKTFAITFDDGYEEVLTLGLPILQEFGFTATVFAVPGQLGGANVWDDGQAKLLTADNLRQLDKAGITIGAHTCQHVHLTQVDAATARREIQESKTLLENTLGHAVTLFAYPYGESNNAVEAMVKEAGFAAAFATDRAPLLHADNLYRVRRSVVFPKNSAFQILIKAQTWYPAYQEWKRGGSAETPDWRVGEQP